MAETLGPMAQFLSDSREVSGDRFRRDVFAMLLVKTFVQLCAGHDVAVELDGDSDEPAVRIGRPADPGTAHFTLINGDATVGVVDVFAALDAAPLDEDLLASFVLLAAAHLERELAVRAANARADQLETALQSRVAIEQAKGMVAHYRGISVEVAFSSLRAHARVHRRQLQALCRSVVAGDIPIERIPVAFSAMQPTRRQELRTRAIERWRQTMSESHTHLARATAAKSRSAELRIEFDQRRAQFAADVLGRSIDHHFRQACSRRSADRNLPTVLIGDDRDVTREFAFDTLAREGRLELVGTAVTGTDALGRSIVEQPDLLILGLDMEVMPGEEFMTQLRRFCPDSRTLVVVANEHDVPRVRSAGADAAVVFGDAAALTSRALELCGVRGAR
jgi:AmiR/NasT family two-component response regulator